MPICWLCERSQEHRGHQTVLIEEVVQEYKEKLQAALQKLMADKKEFENWKDDLQKERTYWQNQIQKDVENVQSEFKGMRDIMDSEEKKELQKLMQEKEDIKNSLEESENEYSQQRCREHHKTESYFFDEEAQNHPQGTKKSVPSP